MQVTSIVELRRMSNLTSVIMVRYVTLVFFSCDVSWFNNHLLKKLVVQEYIGSYDGATPAMVLTILASF